MNEMTVKIQCPRCTKEIEIKKPVQNFSVSIEGEICRTEIISFVFKCPNPKCNQLNNWQNKARKK